MNSTPPKPSQSQRILSATAALCNCLTAGSIGTFPLWASPLARSLHLTSSQLNLLASSAILGEYATAATWGALADSYGPGTVSIGAGASFALGYGAMGLVAKLGAQIDKEGKEINKLLWALLCVTYFLAGCGVAGSYFSAMISSTKSAPARHSGLAIGVPCAVFGLSPLFLSSLASYFTTEYDRFPNLPGTSEMELDPGRWLLCLAALLAIVNGIGGIFLKELPWEDELDTVDKAVSDSVDGGDQEAADERTSLLSSRDRARSTSHSHSRRPSSDRRQSSTHSRLPHHHHPHSQTLRQFISTPTFWLFGSLILLSTGPVEMYMASLGQILESLLAISTREIVTPMKTGISHALQARKDHIAVLAVANTVSRLVVGALSDYLSTPAVATAEEGEGEGEGSRAGTGRKRISRLVFLMGACAGLALVYVWGGTGLSSESGLWIITIINGTSYGAIFTLSPAIVRSCWPVEHFGRNWGLLTWFSAIGALIFTPLFGILRDLATSSSSPSLILDTCASSGCYKPIFIVSAISSGLSCGVVGLLWRKWNAIV
ncbi:uncharacterized protein JCM6883_005932 [Sporobolomyces salmoneus]|uniref:uncharacterized protein n=1 Tax=Sporobolomyces salmoneus TaxID=183962 RepID=UPI00317E9BB5